MRSGAVGLALWLWLLVSGGIASVAAPRGGSLSIAGKEFIRVEDWASANHFEMRWLKREEAFQLSKGNDRLQFTIDSREAQINGIGAWLLFPIAIRGGAAYLSQLDLQNTLQPILNPPRNR